MSVGIAEVETLVVFSPVDTAFNGNTVLGEVHLPLTHLYCLDGESDMHGAGAIVRRKDASRHCCWLQRGLFFEEQKNLVICHLQRAKPEKKGTEAKLFWTTSTYCGGSKLRNGNSLASAVMGCESVLLPGGLVIFWLPFAPRHLASPRNRLTFYAIHVNIYA
jgi:hypothetical protein